MMLVGIIKREIKESWESVKNLKADPLGSLGQLIPVAIVVIALIGLIIKEFRFVVGGGLMRGLGGEFSYGPRSITLGLSAKVIIALAAAQLVVVLLAYRKTADKEKGTVASVCLAAGTVLVGINGFVLAVLYGITTASDALAESLYTAYTNPVFAVMFKLLTLSGAVSLIAFTLMMVKSEHSRMIKSVVIAVFISLVIIPVSSIMLENAIPIIAGILKVVLYSVGVVLLGGLLLLFLWFMLSGGSGGSGGSYERRDCEVNEKSKNADRQTKPEQWIITRDAELRVETTAAGTTVVRAYAQGLFSNKYDEPITFHLYGDPTLDEFKKNKVEIIIQGKKMTEKDLHY